MDILEYVDILDLSGVLVQAAVSTPTVECTVLQGKRANFLIFDFLQNKSIHMLSVTMKLGQGDRVSVCGFVG